MKVIVGSTNPVKIDAVKDVFGFYFKDVTVFGIDTDSKVSHTPFNDDIFMGANNRAITNNSADYHIGIEGGLLKVYDQWFLLTVACIKDNKGNVQYGFGPGIPMPQAIVDRVMSGEELGDITDELVNLSNTKQKGGITEILTKGLTVRKDPIVQAVMRALVPFINKEIYP